MGCCSSKKSEKEDAPEPKAAVRRITINENLPFTSGEDDFDGDQSSGVHRKSIKVDQLKGFDGVWRDQRGLEVRPRSARSAATQERHAERHADHHTLRPGGCLPPPHAAVQARPPELRLLR